MKVVYRDQMSSVFTYKRDDNDEITVLWALNNLTDKQAEVLYLVDNDHLWGIISWGDVFRFLEKRTDYIVNKRYTVVYNPENSDTTRFFETHPTIHELPLVDENDFFLGVCQKEDYNKSDRLKKYQNHVEELYMGIGSYWKQSINRFTNSYSNAIYLFELPDDLEVLKLLPEQQREEFERIKETPLEILSSMSETEKKIYWGNEYCEGISRKFVQEFKEMKYKIQNGVVRFENKDENQYFTFQDGLRCVPNTKKANKKLYMIGPCTVFGAYVTNTQTVEYYLQEKLNTTEFKYQIVDGGAPGLYKEFQYLLTSSINKEDMVVILTTEHALIDTLKSYKQVHYLGSLSDIYSELENPLSCILDNFRHVNYRVNQLIAERVYFALIPYLNQKEVKEKEIVAPIQNYFISWEIFEYYKKFAMKYQVDNLSGRIGAIVMNCNPFTKGHRYLIEYAARQVDRLLVFVVEEDLSAFAYEDRFAMVQLGTEDLKNVTVLPSGKYNISKSTFAQYFEKDKPIKCVDSMEYDCRVFCEVIAPIMHISCRFVGEEPSDIVTNSYNKTMQKIFSLYDLELFEIPRKKEDSGQEVISASRVRKAMELQDWEKAKSLLPESSIQYIKEKSLWQKFQ